MRVPQIIRFNRIFHEINHPAIGVPPPLRQHQAGPPTAQRPGPSVAPRCLGDRHTADGPRYPTGTMELPSGLAQFSGKITIRRLKQKFPYNATYVYTFIHVLCVYIYIYTHNYTDNVYIYYIYLYIYILYTRYFRRMLGLGGISH